MAGSVDAQAAGATGPFTQGQVSAGRIAFLINCAGCHGSYLLGGSGPPLVGESFLEDWSYKSAGALFRFASNNMPFNAAGTLPRETYVNLVAFILAVNGAGPGPAPFTGTSDVAIGSIADGNMVVEVIRGTEQARRQGRCAHHVRAMSRHRLALESFASIFRPTGFRQVAWFKLLTDNFAGLAWETGLTIRRPPPMTRKSGMNGSPALMFGACFALAGLAIAAPGNAATWYVSASANSNGDGTKPRPFNRLRQAQDASAPGDTIMIEPSAASVEPLNGGIALKPGQRLIGDGPPILEEASALTPNEAAHPAVMRAASLAALPRIENTGNDSNSGDAVELADNTLVQNIVIAAAYRGGIYGKDVAGVVLQGNDVTGFNSSGTTGFRVQPFVLESYIAGLPVNAVRPASNPPPAPAARPAGAAPSGGGIAAGWAGIMIDSAKTTSVLISRNLVHDGKCGDGIDIRGMGQGDINAILQQNFVTRLPQCKSVGTMEGIGTQVTGTAHLRVSLDSNTESDNGSDGANADSLFVNPAEDGTLIETINNNVYLNGIGGRSTNGMEYILSNGSAKSQLTISNSYFEGNPGDMLEEFDRGGRGSSTALILDHVKVKGTTVSGGNPSYAMPAGEALTPDNTGECLGIGSVGANDTTVLEMTDSEFTQCGNNGIEVTNNHVPTVGDGDPHTVSLDISNSKITGSKFYNLWIDTVTALTNLKVRVQDSDLSGSTDGIAVAFDQQPTARTRDYVIDLGGGSLGSEGRNCISGGKIRDVETTGYAVNAAGNWWGKPGGPDKARLQANGPGSSINTGAPLDAPPAGCSK